MDSQKNRFLPLLDLRGAVVALALGCVASPACVQTDFGRGGDDLPGAEDGGGDDGPGDDAWRDEDISCDDASECAAGEACIDGLCQMARCKDGPYESAKPLGDYLYFFQDHELLTNDTEPYEEHYYVDGYAPKDLAIDYPGSWDMGQMPVLDIAGGNLLGERPEVFAVAVEGQDRVVIGGGSDITVNVGFQAIGLAVGDVDGDRNDELVALSADGDVTICHVEEKPKRCKEMEFPASEGIDVSIADVDGDGLDEPVFLLVVDANHYLFVWNSLGSGNDEEDYGEFIEPGLNRIDVGDIDGDGQAELVAFQDDAWGFWNEAYLRVYSLAGGIKEKGSHVIHSYTEDISLADIDMDKVDEVVAVRSTGEVEVLRGMAPGTLVSEFETQLSVSVSPNRIDASDFDGDSPATKLAEGPELVMGDVVPTMVLHFPPYDRERSDDEPYVFVGQSDVVSEAFTDSVSLSMGVDVGISVGLFDIFEASMSVGIREEIERSKTLETTLTIGDRFKAEPDIDRFGFDYGVVVLSAGCFHAYTYQVDDPGNKLGGDGEPFKMLVPVAGATTLWSTKRYNAMAEAVGGLPIVEINHELGVPESYPNSPEKPDGSAVPPEDLVFPEVPSYLVSDAGYVGWWLSVGEYETNETSMRTTFEVNGDAKLGPFTFGGHLGQGWGQAYSLTVGQEALFGGGVPPIPDDPETPEDEYQLYNFAFAPIVYRERYVDAAGNDAAYYVLSFATGH